MERLASGLLTQMAAAIGLAVGAIGALFGILTLRRSHSQVRGPWKPWAAIVGAVILILTHRVAQFFQVEWFLLVCDIAMVVGSLILPVALLAVLRWDPARDVQAQGVGP